VAATHQLSKPKEEVKMLTKKHQSIMEIHQFPSTINMFHFFLALQQFCRQKKSFLLIADIHVFLKQKEKLGDGGSEKEKSSQKKIL
jgi:hypothetical protein